MSCTVDNSYVFDEFIAVDKSLVRQPSTPTHIPTHMYVLVCVYTCAHFAYVIEFIVFSVNCVSDETFLTSPAYLATLPPFKIEQNL